MSKLKKYLRYCLLVLLITLASIGIGISGGIPVPIQQKKKDIIENSKDYSINEDEE